MRQAKVTPDDLYVTTSPKLERAIAEIVAGNITEMFRQSPARFSIDKKSIGTVRISVATTDIILDLKIGALVTDVLSDFEYDYLHTDEADYLNGLAACLEKQAERIRRHVAKSPLSGITAPAPSPKALP